MAQRVDGLSAILLSMTDDLLAVADLVGLINNGIVSKINRTAYNTVGQTHNDVKKIVETIKDVVKTIKMISALSAASSHQQSVHTDEMPMEYEYSTYGSR